MIDRHYLATIPEKNIGAPKIREKKMYFQITYKKIVFLDFSLLLLVRLSQFFAFLLFSFIVITHFALKCKSDKFSSLFAIALKSDKER